jgi:tyrosinase
MSHMMHGTQRFLPWHRVYLVQLEQALQAIHPDVTIPYWDWTKAAEEGVPPWLASFTPTVPLPSGLPISVIRSPGTAADLAILASNIPGIMGQEISLTSGSRWRACMAACTSGSAAR